MATQIKSHVTTDDLAGSKIDRYVGQQLKRTSQQVRLSDFVTGIIAVVSFVLAFFIFAAIIDAWLWPLTPFARVIALTLFAGGIGAIFWLTVWPLMVRKINPQYAAKMIEEARPGFKNSLLNYLELKRDQRPVHRAILNEVSKRAATDLSQVSIDSAVDKSNLIRFGFVLVGLVALSIGYLIFSPKSPLPTVMRVLAPGARIAPPAVVMIQSVTPGDTAVFFGDRLEITAQVSGTHDVDDVNIVYSAQDAQIVEAVLPMQYSGANGIYSAILETGPTGIQQPLHYYITARDGVSPTYAIDVRPNPSISINSIKITPPKYTNLPARTIEGYGEIQAVEGSKIEINAIANLPIDVAYIVPLIADDESAESGEYRELRAIPMKSDGRQASGQFVAALNSNRNRPLFTHYKMKFRSTNDFQNDQANVYAIRVIADLAPDVEIVEPAQKEIAIPVNQPFPVEVWASDLDYEISSIDLHIDHQGTRILDRNLELEVDGQSEGGRVTAGLQLTPSDLSLEPGDKAIIFATASDNRISPGSDLPDPNISRTENYTLIVTDEIANPKQPKSPQQDKSSNQKQEPIQNQQNPGKADSTGESQDETGGQSEGSDGNTVNDGAEAQPQEPADSQSTDSDQDTDSKGNETDEPGDDSQGSSKPGPSGQESAAGGESASNQADREESEDGGSAASESDGNESDQAQNAGSQAQDQTDSAGQQRNGSESGQENGDVNQKSDGSTAGSKGQESGGSQEQGSPTGQDGENSNGQTGGSEFRDEQLQNGDSQPLNKNASESERFERLKEYFEQQQQQENEAGGRASDRSNDPNSSELQAGGEQTKAADAANNDRSNPDESEKSNASSTDQPASQRSENSNSQPENQQSKNNDSEQARDGDPDQPVPNSSESENGKPEETENGKGAKSEKDQPGTQPTDSNTEMPNQQSEAAKSKGDKAGGESPATDGAESSESTGESSSTGEPSSNNEPSSNSEPSTKPNSSPSTEPGNAAGGQESESNSKSPQPNTDAQPGGVGGGVESQPNSKSPVEDNPNPDKANLDYAKKVTDLILKNLEEQKYEPDQELLDQMNWTQQDLDNFLKSWQLMKDNAKTGNIKAQQEYVEALRSLGLDRDPKGRRVDRKRDDLFQLNEDGAVDQIPAEYVDPFNSYLKRRNRSKRN